MIAALEEGDGIKEGRGPIGPSVASIHSPSFSYPLFFFFFYISHKTDWFEMFHCFGALILMFYFSSGNERDALIQHIRCRCSIVAVTNPIERMLSCMLL